MVDILKSTIPRITVGNKPATPTRGHHLNSVPRSILSLIELTTSGCAPLKEGTPVLNLDKFKYNRQMESPHGCGYIESWRNVHPVGADSCGIEATLAGGLNISPVPWALITIHKKQICRSRNKIIASFVLYVQRLRHLMLSCTPWLGCWIGKDSSNWMSALVN